MSYYQVTPGQKRLVEAYVNFGKLCAVTRSADLLATLAKKGVYPCAISKATNLLASKAYTLQVSWEPLNWFELMNLFQFTVDVYLGFFTLVAMASMILGVRPSHFLSSLTGSTPHTCFHLAVHHLGHQSPIHQDEATA